ncbi:MAG: hypothetical protein IJH28_01960 [Mogibacterium sp.]|nr:hypothetical protein [Mogibacterium sp.]
MKKNARILALMMALVMTFAMGLSACGKKAAPDEGQNPIMNYVGYYVCDRANVFISADGEEGASAIVTWSSSAWENSTWMMSGTFDPETLQFEYHDCVKTDYKYKDDGDVESQEEVYTGGHGFMFFKEGDPLSLTWQDDQEKVAEDMVFEYAGANPENNEAGMANPWSDVDSAEAAAEGAGLDTFMVPDGEAEISLGEVKVTQYRCMKGMAEAVVEFPAVEMTIRKGDKSGEMAEGDISGDYSEYKYDWTQNIKGLEVKCFGNRDGEATKTIWSVDDMDYSITVQGLGGDEDYGLPADDLNSLINGIQ